MPALEPDRIEDPTERAVMATNGLQEALFGLADAAQRLDDVCAPSVFFGSATEDTAKQACRSVIDNLDAFLERAEETLDAIHLGVTDGPRPTASLVEEAERMAASARNMTTGANDMQGLVVKAAPEEMLADLGAEIVRDVKDRVLKPTAGGAVLLFIAWLVLQLGGGRGR